MSNSGPKNTIYQKLIFSLIICALISIVIRNLITGAFINGQIHLESQITTFALCLIATLISANFLEYISKTPISNMTKYVLSVYTISYLTTGTIILIFRFDYARIDFFVYVITTLIVSLSHYKDRVEYKTFLCISDDFPQNVGKKIGIRQANSQADLDLNDLSGLVYRLSDFIDVAKVKSFTDASLKGIPTIEIDQIEEVVYGYIPIKSAPLLTLDIEQHKIYIYFKALIDIALSIILLPAVAIVIFFCAIAIKLDSRGPIFFVQERVGYRGKIFKILKLRTMYKETSKEFARSAVVNDQRITRVGRFLRKYKFDELPQLLNIIKGEMSLIGPRPEPLNISNAYLEQFNFYALRHLVKPGISGWAAVMQGYVSELEDAKRKLEYDFFYIKNISMFLDLLIVIKTIKLLMTGRNSR